MRFSPENLLSLILLLLLYNASAATATQYQYEVNVNGMVCAYCAYSVSKRFATLSGVDDESVDVNLRRGQVRFTSSESIPESEISAVLQDSGFNIVRVNRTIRDETTSKEISTPVELARISFANEAVDTPMVNNLLDILGETAINKGGHFIVTAPKEQESAILKPLIGGRQKAIPVRFSPSDKPRVTVILLQD